VNESTALQDPKIITSALISKQYLLSESKTMKIAVFTVTANVMDT